jgi:hypothetical protein
LRLVYGERDLTGFSRIRRINDENAIYSADDNAPVLHAAKGLHPVAYVLITNRLATLYELKYRYTIWEAIDLYEAAMVNLYNRYVLLENKK